MTAHLTQDLQDGRSSIQAVLVENAKTCPQVLRDIPNPVFTSEQTLSKRAVGNYDSLLLAGVGEKTPRLTAFKKVVLHLVGDYRPSQSSLSFLPLFTAEVADAYLVDLPAVHELPYCVHRCGDGHLSIRGMELVKVDTFHSQTP